MLEFIQPKWGREGSSKDPAATLAFGHSLMDFDLGGRPSLENIKSTKANEKAKFPAGIEGKKKDNC